MISSVKIGSKKIGPGYPIFVVADLGLTCGGDIHETMELIEISAEIGVNAVKFQMLDADALLGDKDVTYTYPTLLNGHQTENMYTMFKGLEFSDTQWAAIRDKAYEKNLEMIVTAHYEGAVSRINRLDLPINKICTWSLSHQRLLRLLAANGKDLVIDMGTIDEAELLELHSFYVDNGGGQVVILHDFHTENASESNFRALSRYENLGFVYGYAPQGRKDWLDYMAVGQGISIIEKRLTLDRERPRNGYWKALEKEEFINWLANLRECEKSLGTSEIKPTLKDLEQAKKYYKSAWLNQDVNEGDLIKEDHFIFKRPGTGILSGRITNFYCGKRYTKFHKKGEMLNEPV